MLKAVLIDDSFSDLQKIEQINKESFLKKDQVPISYFPVLPKSKFTYSHAFYDDDVLVAFTIVAYTYKMMYLAYLAVDKSQRGRGIGSKILDYCKTKMKIEGKDILLCAEAPSKYVKNNEQRVSRISFYKRNGFYIVGDKTVMNSIEYVYMSNNPSLDKNTINKELEQHVTCCSCFINDYPQMSKLRDFF